MEEYGITNRQQAVLPISIFLIGYVLGPLFFGPLSEQYGRRMIVIVTFVGFTIFTMACARTPTWTAFIIFRLFCGITASAPIVVVGGIYADIYDDPNTRGLAMAIFMAVSLSSRFSLNILRRLKISGNRPWASFRPHRFWLYFSSSGLALDFLDWPHHSRRMFATNALHS